MKTIACTTLLSLVVAGAFVGALASRSPRVITSSVSVATTEAATRNVAYVGVTEEGETLIQCFAPGVSYPDGIYACDTVRLDDNGCLAELVNPRPVAEVRMIGDCTPIAQIVDNAILISCRDDSCATVVPTRQLADKACVLYRVYTPGTEYSCKCELVVDTK